MNISDIIDLAKAGYKPADVFKLLELVETSPALKEAPPEKIEDAKQIDEKQEVIEEVPEIKTKEEPKKMPSAEDVLDKLFD